MVLGLSSLGALSAFGFAACSSPSSGGDNGPDSSVDATNDVQPTPVNDAGDAGTDAPATDAADAADVQVPFDAGDADAQALILDFPTNIQAAWCQHIAQCCAVDDAGAFDMAHCMSIEKANGGVALTLIPGVSGAVATGNLHYDPAKAAQCFADIAAIKCDGSETAAHWVQFRTDCFAAMNGTLGVGSTCGSSFECSPGNYCQLGSADAGTGKCAAIQPLDGGCANESNYACTYQQSGTAPAQWCNPSTNTCVTPTAEGGTCNKDRECQTGACDLGKCSPTVSGPSVGICSLLAIKDAGGD
jgi:hypothetical protein